MPGERFVPTDQTTAIIQTYLGDKNSLHILITSKGADFDILADQADAVIAGLGEQAAENLVGTLMHGLSQDTKEWDVDKRDGALELLGLVDLNKLDRQKLLQIYLDAVSTQNRFSDPLGSIHSLLEAGDMIVESLPLGETTRRRFSETWHAISNQFDEDDRKSINDRVKNIVEEIYLEPEDLLGNPDSGRLGRREMPSLEDPERQLHDFYLESVNKQHTFKPTLWDNTPEFRETCQRYGISLEMFWNINDPESVAQAVARLRTEEQSEIHRFFNTSLRQEARLTLDDLSEEKTRVLADEVVKAELLGGEKQLSDYRKQMVHKSEHLRHLTGGKYSTRAFELCLKSHLPIKRLDLINQMRAEIGWGGTPETGMWTYVSGVERDIDTQVAKPVRVAFTKASEDMRKVIDLGTVSKEELDRIEEEILADLKVA